MPWISLKYDCCYCLARKLLRLCEFNLMKLYKICNEPEQYIEKFSQHLFLCNLKIPTIVCHNSKNINHTPTHYLAICHRKSLAIAISFCAIKWILFCINKHWHWRFGKSVWKEDCVCVCLCVCVCIVNKVCRLTRMHWILCSIHDPCAPNNNEWGNKLHETAKCHKQP